MIKISKKTLKEKIKEFDEKIKYLRTLEKDILVGLFLGVTGGKDTASLKRFIKLIQKPKRQSK